MRQAILILLLLVLPAHAFALLWHSMGAGNGGGPVTTLTFAYSPSSSFGTVPTSISNEGAVMVDVCNGTWTSGYGGQYCAATGSPLASITFSGSPTYDTGQLATGALSTVNGATGITNCTGTLATGSICQEPVVLSSSVAGAGSGHMILTDSRSYTYRAAVSWTASSSITVVNVTSCATLSGLAMTANDWYSMATGLDCTGGIQFHTASGATLQGDCSDFLGANDTFDAANGPVGGGGNLYLTDGGLDLSTSVTLKCFTVARYGGSTGCSSGPEYGCGDCGSPASENWCAEGGSWNGWLIENTTWVGSGGIGLGQAGGSIAQDSLFATAGDSAWACQPGLLSSASGTIQLIASEIVDSNAASRDSQDDNVGQKCIQYGQANEAMLLEYNYVHGNNSNGLWCDGNCPGPAAQSATYQWQLVGNTVINNKYNGIRCEISYNCVVTGNIINNNNTSSTAYLDVDCSSCAYSDFERNAIAVENGGSSGVRSFWEGGATLPNEDNIFDYNAISLGEAGNAYGNEYSADTTTVSDNNTFYLPSLSTDTNFQWAPNGISNASWNTYFAAGVQDQHSTAMVGTHIVASQCASVGCVGDGL